jgi:hypothetical protein
LSTSYKIGVVADIPENNVMEEIKIQTPSQEDENDLNFEINTNYIGYTAVNFQLTALNSAYKNSIILSNDLLYEDYYSSELTITVPPNVNRRESYTLEVISMKNDTLGSYRILDFAPIYLRKADPDDLDVKIFNITHNRFQIVAFNLKSVEYQEQGYDYWNVYIDDVYTGKYQCAGESTVSGYFFPFFTDLTPGTSYSVKVGIDYSTIDPDPAYEPDLDIELLTTVEFQIQTLASEPSSELEVNISNITSNGFDLIWWSETSYVCWDPFPYYYYEFILYIDGTEYTRFDNHTNKIHIEDLQPNTKYSAELILNVYNNNSDITDTRTANFEIETTD